MYLTISVGGGRFPPKFCAYEEDLGRVCMADVEDDARLDGNSDAGDGAGNPRS